MSVRQTALVVTVFCVVAVATTVTILQRRPPEAPDCGLVGTRVIVTAAQCAEAVAKFAPQAADCQSLNDASLELSYVTNLVVLGGLPESGQGESAMVEAREAVTRQRLTLDCYDNEAPIERPFTRERAPSQSSPPEIEERDTERNLDAWGPSLTSSAARAMIEEVGAEYDVPTSDGIDCSYPAEIVAGVSWDCTVYPDDGSKPIEVVMTALDNEGRYEWEVDDR